jgi:hypothetical protein
LTRVSIENDEMMQGGPERALNKIFTTLVCYLKYSHYLGLTIYIRRQIASQRRLPLNLQQAILDGPEYLEENQRELPIWGIPPFGNHQEQFHREYMPSYELCTLINGMKLVEKDSKPSSGTGTGSGISQPPS